MVSRLSPLLTVTALVLWTGVAGAQQAQIDRSRQADVLGSTVVVPLPVPAALSAVETVSGSDGDSFGTQRFLREDEKLRPFRAFAEISAFVTNNVALSRRAPATDSFLLAAAGGDYHRALGHGLQFDSSLRLATFRYNEFRQLDFHSIDVGAGLAYHLSLLGGSDVFLRYNFNELIGVKSEEVFFKNHTITLGMQKTIAFSKAHYAFAGFSGQLGFADPKLSERHELAAYAGYHLEATRRLSVDLLYRYTHYLYSDVDRRDANHALSLGVRYQFTDWFSALASGYAATNHSTLQVFDYDVVNGGGGLSLSLQF